jgi:hypothetical protein
VTRDDAQGALKAAAAKPTPQLGSVPAPGRPLRVECRQERLQRALPDTEDIDGSTSDHPPHDLPAAAGAPDDLLDRHAMPRESADRRRGIFPAQVAVVLQPFGRGQEARIDRGDAQRIADCPHRSPNGVEEGHAGIFHQVPPIRHLDRAGQCPRGCFAVTAAAIAGDDPNAGMGVHPW